MNQGTWLKLQIQQRKMTVSGFAATTGISRSQLKKWFTQPQLTMRADLMWAVLDALGLAEAARSKGHVRGDAKETKTGWDQYVAGHAATTVFQQLRAMELRGELPSPAVFKTVKERRRTPPQELTAGQALADIPLFDLSIAAGPWADVMDVPDFCGADSIRQGLFRARLAGDSMTPTYTSGMIVEFECVRPYEPIRLGGDYYVQLDDGTATFKRVQRIDEERITLIALNKKRCPQPLIADRSNIVRMALAKGEFRPFGESL